MSAPMVYEIRVEGHLDQRWSRWFEGMEITLTGNGETVLQGPIPDQAALHGVLMKVRDIGLPLISLRRVEIVVQDDRLA